MVDIQTLKSKYSDQVPTPIVAIAKELGLVVYETDEFSPEQSGSIKKENDTFVIYLNASHPPTRKRFTLAHEVAHYLLHRDCLEENKEFVDTVKQPIELQRSAAVEYSQKEKQMEWEANELAAELLMPEEKFMEEWDKADNIIDVAAAFKVSPSAAAIRGQKLFKTFFS